MVFRTELLSKPVEKKIEYSSKVLFMGSCFSNNIGELLLERKFNAFINPFGTVYNPISMGVQIEKLVKNAKVKAEELTEAEVMYCHHDYHTSFNDAEDAMVVQKINNAINNGHEFIQKADLIFITLGTSWVYELKNNGKIVANCHKRPSSFFQKRLLTINEINESLDKISDRLTTFNPQINIVYTLSPVRHIKDGIEENSLSKALLKVGIYDQIRKNGCGYFPSYEYMMDDLRDYRFYEEDLIHPDKVAIKYIWKKFSETYFSETTLFKMKEIEKIIAFLSHRPFKPDHAYEKKLEEKQIELNKLLLQP